MSRMKRLGVMGVLLFVLGCMSALSISHYVFVQGSAFVVAQNDASAPVILVLGAGLTSDGVPSDILRDRLTVALALYNEQRGEKILCSGDNGQEQYDEVNAMRIWLLEHGVAAEDIFLDHAGFDTYSTMVRASQVFGVTDAIVITQDFHLPRALYGAYAQGIHVQGVSASLQPYVKESLFTFREIPARIKMFFTVFFEVPPMYLGEPIALEGDGRMTWDE